MKSYDKKINQLINLYIRAEKRLINIISTKTVKGQVTDFYRALLKVSKNRTYEITSSNFMSYLKT